MLELLLIGTGAPSKVFKKTAQRKVKAAFVKRDTAWAVSKAAFVFIHTHIRAS